MKTKRIPFALMACTVMLFGAAAAQSEEAKASQTFSGSYDWKQGGSDELRAEFEADGENRWKVTFNFRWNGRDNTWSGNAEGSLKDGSNLSGTATSGGRNWIFDAAIEEGVMRGKHTEIKGEDGKYDTGTFEIKR